MPSLKEKIEVVTELRQCAEQERWVKASKLFVADSAIATLRRFDPDVSENVQRLSAAIYRHTAIGIDIPDDEASAILRAIGGDHG